MNYRTFLFPLINLLISSPTPSTDDAICYFSLNQATQYDSVTTVKAVKQCGDFALGTEPHLSAEFVLLDNKAYGIASDGKVHELSDETPLAYTVVKKFSPDTLFKTGESFSLFYLKRYLSTALHKHSYAAIRIRGKFSSVQCRSFFPLEKPYPPLNSAKAAFFDKENISGTIVGFYTPGSSVDPAYHFHFISDDKSMGGHLRKLELEPGATIQIDYGSELKMTLPSQGSMAHIDLNRQAKMDNE